MTPLKAIRAKCMNCCSGQAKEVRLCPCSDCPLYLFRMGKNPNLKTTRTPAQLAALKNAVFHQKHWTKCHIQAAKQMPGATTQEI